MLHKQIINTLFFVLIISIISDMWLWAIGQSTMFTLWKHDFSRQNCKKNPEGNT